MRTSNLPEVSRSACGPPVVRKIALAVCAGAFLSLCLGRATPMIALSAAFVVIAAGRHLVTRHRDLARPPWLFVALAAWCLGGALLSRWPGPSVCWWLVGLVVCLTAWQLATFPWNVRDREALAWVVVGSGGLVGVAGIAQFASQHAEAALEMGHPNRLAAFLLMVWPVTVAWGRAWRGVARRGIALAAGVAMLGALTVTFSRGGWLGFLLQALYVFPGRRSRLVLVVILVAAAVWVLLPWEMGGLAHTFVPDYRTNVSRVREWAAALRLLSEEPVWGVGVGNFQRAARTDALVPHNFFLHVAAQTGLVGVCLCVGLFGEVWSRLKQRRDGAPGGWALAARVALVGLLGQGLVDY